MEFTSLNNTRFLRLQTKAKKQILAYIDGRGAEPHGFLPADDGLVYLIAMPEDMAIEIIDSNGHEYDEGVRPTDFTMGHIRKQIRAKDLFLYENYQDYSEIQKSCKMEPLAEELEE